ncbi:hypothetical protein Q5752_006520 [Cryptotrichosporon argae]
MAAAPQYGPISQQYAAAATVPLIKSPSLWLPPRVEFPPDVHPLPEDITAYFVYPFTLERHVVHADPSPYQAIAERRVRAAEVLHRRELADEERERAALRRVAPGYNPASLLVPTSASAAAVGAAPAPLMPGAAASTGSGAPSVSADAAAPGASAADPMDDLVARLEEMDKQR